MRLKKLLEGIDVKLDVRLARIDIKSICINSKRIEKDSLFVAIDGSRFDGHKFINDAFEKGALCAVADKQKRIPAPEGTIIKVKDTRKALSVAAKNFYHSPTKKLKVIGITGTNGKTTIAQLIESIFNVSRIPCGVIGTIEYKTGKDHIPAERTTPDALKINTLLSKMLKSKLKAVVMEVSSHALDQKRVDDIFFDAAIFTNLTHEHLDYHGNLEHYFRSKVKIFKNLKKGGIAVINADDRNATRIKKNIKQKVITYGLKKTADITAKIEKVGLNGSFFVVRVHNKDIFFINTKLIGLHNISNILAAVATAIALGLKPRDIKKGIEKIESISGRLESIKAKQKFKVFVDYAHTHNALENVLKFLNSIKRRNIITVFGCGGERDRKKRPLMGHVAQELSDFVIVTNDNPRSENPIIIARHIEKGMDSMKGNYEVVLNRKDAIEKALKKAKDGDIVLIAGKGHEKTQIIGDKEIPFDDREIAKEILKKKL